MSHLEKTPIAIVGIGCRFPQADDADAFWQRIEQGQTSFQPVPEERWNHEIFYDPNPRAIDKAWIQNGSFIENIKDFAALHYGIAPRRLEVMDPQQRLLVETTRWAIQDAGYDRLTFDRSKTGVFVGVSVSEFKNIAQARIRMMQVTGGDFGPPAGSQDLRDATMEMMNQLAPVRAFSLAGSITALDAAAISQTFDLGGPAYTIDAACASASVAVNDAMLHLRTGLIDTAVAGGAYLNLTPDNLVAFTRIGAISKSGICRPFDARSDGFVQSDGVGVLFLKRLEDALSDGDRIHAVLRGTACNNDGRGDGPMSPRPEGQLEVLHTAYADADCSPASVAFFEAHGTATSVGDPAEIQALGTLLTEAEVKEKTLLGSVKGNIGHAMSAAGVASLVKAIKMIEHRTAPPQPDFGTPNKVLGLDRWPLQVSTERKTLEPRPGAPLRIGVSSFGFGGTNSHLILEEPPKRKTTIATTEALTEDLLPEALLITAPEVPLLKDHLQNLNEALSGYAKDASLADIAYTLNARRKHERYRVVIGAKNKAELKKNLERALSAFADKEPTLPLTVSPHVAAYDSGEARAEPKKIAFLFPGQGAQKTFLLDDLRKRFSTFNTALTLYGKACDSLLERPLLSYLYPEVDDGAAEEALKATEVCQPAMAALGLALAAQLNTFGIEADVSLGHSLGEFAALADGGVLDPAEAVRLVAVRGRAMHDLSLEDPGTMAAVMGNKEDVLQAIEDLEEVWLANVNHNRQVSISGTHPGVERAMEKLKADGFKVQPLKVSHAFHTPLLAPIRDTFEEAVNQTELASPQHPVASCIEGAPHPDDKNRIAETLIAHATSTVDFVRGLHQADEAGATVYVQVGAGAILTSFAKGTLDKQKISTVNLAPLEPDGGYELLRGLCTLAALGFAVDFEAVYQGEKRTVVSLPETPLLRSPYWVIKERPQPLPVLDTPLSESADAVVTAKAEQTESDPSLVELFQQQAAILESHAEIIRTQNRVLLGEASPPSEVLAETTPSVSDRVTQIIEEPPTVEERPPQEKAPEPEQETAPEPAKPKQGVKKQVTEIIARISAFPPENVRIEQRLVDELGFDSLMVADLNGALANAFPNMGSIPATLFSLDTTVRDIIDHILGPAESDEAETVDISVFEDPEAETVDISMMPEAPISRYQVEATEQERADLSVHEVEGETWLVTEDGSPLASEISAALSERGAKLLRVQFTKEGVAAPAQLSFGSVNLWPEAFADGLPDAIEKAETTLDGFIHASGLAIKDEREFVNPITLLHPLAAAIEVPRFATVTALGGRLGLVRSNALARNVLQAALPGYTKALARERPSRIVRALDIDPNHSATENAKWVVEELLSGDLTLEAGYSSGKRYIATLTESTAAEGTTDLKDAVVLITGGAGNIGAMVAERLAPQAKGILLVDRRERDQQIEDLLRRLEALGTRAAYAVADVTDPETLRRAAEQAGFGKQSAKTGGSALPDRDPKSGQAGGAKMGGSALPIRDPTSGQAGGAQRPEAAKMGGSALPIRDPSSVTLVIHAAGLIEDARAPKKSLESVHRVMDVKVRAVQSILQAFTDLEDLVFFSSWAGRFGNAGQVDYSAANDLLDRIAITGVGSVRVISIAWPPWASTAMSQSIPAPLRSAMSAEGVTFLEDEEGLDILQAILCSKTHGLEVVGREMPTREIRVQKSTTFSTEDHPYLLDHQLKGRPVVPLACAIDLCAWSFLSKEEPFTLSNLELVRGLMGGERAVVTTMGKAGDLSEARVEIRTDDAEGQDVRPVAYRAKIRTGGAALPLPAIEGEQESISLSLEKFYAEHTFHGPLLQGVTRVEAMSLKGITGEVRTTKIANWMPKTERKGWAIDPLVVDSAFQLAAYWLHVHHNKAGYPTGFDQLVMERPFGEGPIRVTVILGKIEKKIFRGDIYLADAKGPIATLKGVRGRVLTRLVKKQRDNGEAIDIPKEHYVVGTFPEVEQLDQRIQMADLMGLKNPYFPMHAGIARDTSVINGVEMVNYSNYNYLGFSGHPEVVQAAQEAIERYGTSVSASRVASGERPIHQELERGLAEHVGVEDAVVFVSGHATNVTTIGHLFDRNDLIVHDSLIHDSILQGITLSGATRRPYPHGDLDALEQTLAQTRKNYRRLLICAEGIYSMDGDVCELPRLIALKKRFKGLLLIDEAHSVGVLGPAGRGVGHHFEAVDPKDVDIWMGTLSKSFASCGGYIAGSHDLVRYLKYTTPGFVYSAGITPPNAAAAIKSLELMHKNPQIVEQLRSRSRLFLDLAKQEGLDTGLAYGAAVVPVIVGNSLVSIRLSERLAERQINVQPIFYPAVEDDAARLRFFISAVHTEEQIRRTIRVLTEELAAAREESQNNTSSLSL